MSVFLGTAEVESKYLIVRAEKDEFQNALAKILLKGVLHERSASNEINKALPPVVPHQLVVLPHSEFCCVI